MAQVGETRLADDQFQRIVRELTLLVERQIVAALLTTSALNPDQAVTRYREILARMEH